MKKREAMKISLKNLEWKTCPESERKRYAKVKIFDAEYEMQYYVGTAWCYLKSDKVLPALISPSMNGLIRKINHRIKIYGERFPEFVK